MMNQMVQMSVVQAITNISTLITDTTNLSYAASLVGKEVIVAQQNGRSTQQISGTGTGTGTLNGTPVIFMGDKSYWLSDVLAVGELPSEEAQAANAQAVKDSQAWYDQRTTSAAQSALSTDDEADALLELTKPRTETTDAISGMLNPNGTTDPLLDLLGTTSNNVGTDVLVKLLNAIDNADNNGNANVPVEVLEDAVQQIGSV